MARSAQALTPSHKRPGRRRCVTGPSPPRPISCNMACSAALRDSQDQGKQMSAAECGRACGPLSRLGGGNGNGTY